MALGDGTAWNESSPSATSAVTQGDEEILDVRKGVRIRVAKEHVLPAAASAGGEHKAGSAKIYVAANLTALEAITTRPDATTSLDASDAGRLGLALDTMYLYVWSGSAWAAAKTTVEGTQLGESYALLHETSTGGFTSGDWRIRNLASEVLDPDGIVTLNTGTHVFTLAAGTYRIKATCPAYKVGRHQAALYCNSTATIWAYGSNGYGSNANDESMTESVVNYLFTITETQNFSIVHKCEVTKATNGMGASVASQLGTTDILTVVEIWKAA